MKDNKPCNLVCLANNEHCEINICPDCRKINLTIGPVNLRLNRHILNHIYDAVTEAHDNLLTSSLNESAVQKLIKRFSSDNN